jgi:hypothetical protein
VLSGSQSPQMPPVIDNSHGFLDLRTQTTPLTGEKVSSPRLIVIQYGIIAVMQVLVILVEANRILKVPILAPRGKILNREGRLRVDNYPSTSCFLIREQGRDITADLPLIARGLHRTVDQMRTILKKYRTALTYQPPPFKQDITPDDLDFIEAHKDSWLSSIGILFIIWRIVPFAITLCVFRWR